MGAPVRRRRFSGMEGEWVPLDGGTHDYDAIVEAAAHAQIVLLGEATHGSHEFYRQRAQITKRLITEQGFAGVAIEADWPDTWRVNRFVQARSGDADAVDALAGFRRFPQWMWRNADVLDFVGWLRAHNDDLPAGAPRVGFYGLDLYSLHASMEAVLAYLDRSDPEAAARARGRYACFESFGFEPQQYGYAAGLGLAPPCEDEVVAQLLELQRRREAARLHDGAVAEDEHFAAVENARVVANAERYYRAMFGGHAESWNLRDTHMADALDGLLRHLRRRGPSRVVVWAHNSHVGNARATQMGLRGEINLGQLCRERRDGAVLDGVGGGVINVGFTTHHGTVSAASTWGGPVERKQLRPALPGSYEELFHAAGVERFLCDLRMNPSELESPRLERAIGVLYLPDSERATHYFVASLARQFDFAVHIDETRAVEPLERTGLWEAGELPETWPSTL
jgi:erythromycin esterase-like protein